MEKADMVLVNHALTHRSYSFEKGSFEDNERLEFLGDAFIGFLVSRYLYEKFPDADEGTLSKKKSSLSSLLGCALEALIGAFYISLPLEDVSLFVLERIVTPSEILLHADVFADYKSRLQECVQKKFKCIPEYKLISEMGPDHVKSFQVEVFILEKSYGKGFGARKKTAENAAARIALDRLKDEEQNPLSPCPNPTENA